MARVSNLEVEGAAIYLSRNESAALGIVGLEFRPQNDTGLPTSPKVSSAQSPGESVDGLKAEPAQTLAMPINRKIGEVQWSDSHITYTDELAATPISVVFKDIGMEVKDLVVTRGMRIPAAFSVRDVYLKDGSRELFALDGFNVEDVVIQSDRIEI